MSREKRPNLPHKLVTLQRMWDNAHTVKNTDRRFHTTLKRCEICVTDLVAAADGSAPFRCSLCLHTWHVSCCSKLVDTEWFRNVAIAQRPAYYHLPQHFEGPHLLDTGSSI